MCVKYSFPLFFLFATTLTYANAEEAEKIENTWIDQQHQSVSQTLHSWSNSINDWLYEPDASKPARGSLRIMMDSEWNRYDGFSYKPRVRGKIKLPALKKRWSLVFGDEDLENQASDKGRVGGNYENLEKDKHYNSKEARNDSASIGLRFSREIEKYGIESDLDGGIRSRGDVFGRFRVSKLWTWNEQFSTRLEQIYRYGHKSRHFARTNLENKYLDSDTTFIMNHTYFEYTRKHKERRDWGHSIYRQHDFGNMKTLSYGLYGGGRLDHDYSRFNSWGPFITYRQPIFRKWLFIKPEISFYNDRDKDRNHYLRTFLRLEAIF